MDAVLLLHLGKKALVLCGFFFPSAIFIKSSLYPYSAAPSKISFLATIILLPSIEARLRYGSQYLNSLSFSSY
ncbi:hypothetical protein D6D85_03950 [Candidatus Methanodesulfokora washburnensis]|uniref:Uncharacterized protein n=1 Tax=Candidatus Methanodesulfokora washburnensis TaxID=2478471 RepID=A0A429GR01_9CREN|nr:hypothetical protein D6D85_03950 [Candidatus Methanodesulfokores washburnensis]